MSLPRLHCLQYLAVFAEVHCSISLLLSLIMDASTPKIQKLIISWDLLFTLMTRQLPKVHQAQYRALNNSKAHCNYHQHDLLTAHVALFLALYIGTDSTRRSPYMKTHTRVYLKCMNCLYIFRYVILLCFQHDKGTAPGQKEKIPAYLYRAHMHGCATCMRPVDMYLYD